MTLLSTLPAPPTLSDSQSAFDTKAAAFLTAIQTMVTEINAGLGGTAVNLALTGATTATTLATTGNVGIGTAIATNNRLAVQSINTLDPVIALIASNSTHTGGITCNNATATSTTSTIIRTGGQNALFVISGTSTIGFKTFVDVVAASYTAITVISSTSQASPGARTYSYSAGDIQLSIAGADTFTMATWGFINQ